MAFIDLKFFSEALGLNTSVYIVIPQKSCNGQIGMDFAENRCDKYKCLYLLHGLSDDHTIWMRNTSIERYASKYGICVVMPCADRSFYTDMKYGSNYYTYIAKELPMRIAEFFNVSTEREDNYVAGLSMGGYGALKIALRENDRFCAGAGLSAVTDIKSKKDCLLSKSIFGENFEVNWYDDLFLLAKTRKDVSNKPKIFMGVGTEDFLYNENLLFKDKLIEYGFDLTYRESHGEHNWAFWDEYIQYVLKWMFEF